MLTYFISWYFQVSNSVFHHPHLTSAAT